jgi:hypothetical protein
MMEVHKESLQEIDGLSRSLMKLFLIGPFCHTLSRFYPNLKFIVFFKSTAY